MGDKLKIAYLCSREHWRRKMSRGARFECPRAIDARPDVEMLFSGPSWPDYVDGLSVGDNLFRIGFKPDVAWAYKPQDMLDFADLDCLKVVTYNEAWWPEDLAARECLEHKIDLVICHHHNDMGRFKRFGLKCRHIPHAANPSLFGCSRYPTRRSIRVLLSGVLSRHIYPLRCEMALAVESGFVDGLIRPHPGYKLFTETECDKQYRDYAAQLGDSMLSLCCTSIHKYFLAKIAESAMAGAVPVTDCPDDPEFEHLKPHCVIVESHAKAEDVASAIERATVGVTADEFHERQLAVQFAAANHFSTPVYAERFVTAVRESLGIAT